MIALMQVMPHWEGGSDISPSVKGHLSEMIKRVMGELDNECPGFGSSESSFSSLDRPASADSATRRNEKDHNLLSDRGTPREQNNSLTGRPRSQPEDSQAVASTQDFFSSPSKVDAMVSTLVASFAYKKFRRLFASPLLIECPCGSCSIQGTNCTSPCRTSRGSRNIINQHLRTIRVLEERLAAKENDVKSKDEALKEATEDLARDERIFAEKVPPDNRRCVN